MNRPLRILRTNDEVAPAIAAFLTGQGDALVYYSAAYRAFLCDLLGCRDISFVALGDDNRVRGLLPMMALDGPWGTIINSLPFYGSNGGVLAGDAVAEGALLAAFNEAAGHPHIAAATLVTHPFRQAMPPPQHDFVDDRIGQWTALPPNDPQAAAALMASFDGSARRNIRKAEQAGVIVTVEPEAITFLEHTHRANMAAIGGKAKSALFFAASPNHFPDHRIYVAHHDGEPIAALLVLYGGRTVEYFTPVVVEEYRPLQGLPLILRTAMLDAIRAGYRWWNWGGTWKTQDGVYRFKRKWGAADLPYRYFTRLNNRDILARSASEILAAYPEFFVVPFAALEKQC